MSNPTLPSLLLAALLLAPWFQPTGFGLAAQEPGEGLASAEAPDTGPFRTLAPGVERTIPPATQKEETYSRHDMIKLLSRDPKFAERPLPPGLVKPGEPPESRNLAKNVRYAHDVWGLEFTFKPMRIIQVDVPNARGTFDRKNIWYLAYRVTNRGQAPVRFVPRFVLQSLDTGDKFYTDRVIPVSVDPIREVEDPNRALLNSVEIAEEPIPPSGEGEENSVWGVATWEDIDPRTDEFSIYVQGLTNAYKIVQDANQRGYLRKTLKLNFWRPGDEFLEDSSEIRFGVPGQVAYEWVYK